MAWYHRVGNTIRPGRIDRAIDEELSFHLAERVDELVASGLSESDARRQARRQFGSATLAKERTREVKMMQWLESIARDVRFGLRSFARHPVFTAVAVLTLALGIGANTAIFTLLDAALLRPIPVDAPEELVVLGGSARGMSFSPDPVEHSAEQFSYPLYEDLRASTDVFDDLAAIRTVDTTVYVREARREAASLADPATARQVSGNYFRTLGVSAIHGRTLEEFDNLVPGAHPNVVLSYGYWQRRFASNADVVGAGLVINGRTFTVIGVMPAGFRGETVGTSPDLYAPLMMQEAIEGLERISSRQWTFLLVLGRLRDGITREQAEAATTVAFQQALRAEAGGELSSERAARIRERRITLAGQEGFSRLRRDYGIPLQLLMGMVGVVLLIACANIANLSLGRTAARQREIGMRVALGASRRRVIRQLLTESTLLAASGGAIGVIIGIGAQRVLARMVFQTEALPVDLGLDARVLAFTCGISLLAALLFGLAPAYRATRNGVAHSLTAGAWTAVGGRSRFDLGRALIVAQVALSLVLLVGAAIFVANLRQLRDVDLGLRADQLHIVDLDFSAPGLFDRDDDQAHRRILYRQLLERVRSLPGVDSAGLARRSLFARGMVGGDVTIDGVGPVEGTDAFVAIVSATSGYFDAAGIPLVDGRTIEDRDSRSSPFVAVVNRTFANRFFPGARATGRRFRFQWEENWREIVGVAADARYNSLKDAIPAQVFIPAEQSASPLSSLAIRTRQEAPWVAAQVRRIVGEVEPALPVRDVTTVEARVDALLTQEHVLATLSSVFGSLGLLLAAIGLFGVMNYAVARRTPEIGLRLALGAEPRTVWWMVLRDALLLVGLGAVAGLVAVLPTSRLIESQLYQVSARDPLAIALAMLVLAVVAITAASLPAWRAARVDPIVSLRQD